MSGTCISHRSAHQCPAGNKHKKEPSSRKALVLSRFAEWKPSMWLYHIYAISIYVSTDFDTKEKALSRANAAEKGLK